MVPVALALVTLQVLSSGLNLLGANQHLATAVWGLFPHCRHGVAMGRWPVAAVFRRKGGGRLAMTVARAASIARGSLHPAPPCCGSAPPAAQLRDCWPGGSLRNIGAEWHRHRLIRCCHGDADWKHDYREKGYRNEGIWRSHQHVGHELGSRRSREGCKGGSALWSGFLSRFRC